MICHFYALLKLLYQWPVGIGLLTLPPVTSIIYKYFGDLCLTSCVTTQQMDTKIRHKVIIFDFLPQAPSSSPITQQTRMECFLEVKPGKLAIRYTLGRMPVRWLGA